MKKRKTSKSEDKKSKEVSKKSLKAWNKALVVNKKKSLTTVKLSDKQKQNTKNPPIKKSLGSKETSKANTKKLNSKKILLAYTNMLKARLTDEKIIILYKQNKVHFQIGVAGHEAIQAACGLIFEPAKDWFHPYYRDMALMVSLGMTVEELILNALNKDADPNSHGRQLPMHYGDKSKNVVSQSSPTGTQFSQAVGNAKALKLKKKRDVVYVSAGEGACSQGWFHEALNSAAIEKLPVVFIIQSNDYAISVPIEDQIAGGSVAKIASAYEGLETIQIDGTDLVESFKSVQKAYNRAKEGKGATLIEAKVPRLQSHSISDNQEKYRSKKEIEDNFKKCPIKKLEKYILKNKITKKKDLENIFNIVKIEINESCLKAEQAPDPSPESIYEGTYDINDPALYIMETPPSGKDIYMVDAINHALKEEMRINTDVYVFGQDVAGDKGGVFSATTGLTAEFGEDRCFNAQLAEASIVAKAFGMSVAGLKPVPEIQFADYIWPAMSQIRNEVAMLSYRTKGDWTCPITMRVPVGGYISGALYHSQNIESFFAHCPGLFVVYPSNATDAKALLKASIRSTNPVMFLEHKGLYRQNYAMGPEGDENYLIPLGKARILQTGKDLTIVTYGALVYKSLWAAEQLAEEGYEIEVIDLRTIVPLDRDTIFASVQKTGKALIVHEDVEFMGFGAEIAAQIANDCFEFLDAPIKRVGMKYIGGVPHSPILEQTALPQNEDILTTALELLEY